MKPIVSQCAAVSNEKDPTRSRCAMKPGSNHYFCDVHWNQAHKSPIPAVQIRDMPGVIRRIGVVCYVQLKGKNSPKVNDVDENLKPLAGNNTNKSNLKPGIISRIIDYTLGKKPVVEKMVDKVEEEKKELPDEIKEVIQEKEEEKRTDNGEEIIQEAPESETDLNDDCDSSDDLEEEVEEKEDIPEKDDLDYINSRIDEFKGMRTRDIVTIAKSMGISGKFTRKQLIIEIIKKDSQEVKND